MIKIIKPFLFIVIIVSFLAWAIYYYQEKTKPSIKVCSSPENCKVVYGASVDDIKNNLGSPAEHHREGSMAKIETEEDFIKGYFDEKTFYYRHKNKVFYFVNAKIRTGFSEDTGELLGSDAKTFEIIDANFSKDKKHVYARSNMETSIAYQILEGADPKTFTPLDFPYAKDKTRVYYLNHAIVNADPATFKILDNKICGQDKNNYYKDGVVSNEVDCK